MKKRWVVHVTIELVVEAETPDEATSKVASLCKEQKVVVLGGLDAALDFEVVKVFDQAARKNVFDRVARKNPKAQ